MFSLLRNGVDQQGLPGLPEIVEREVEQRIADAPAD
jgi:hypothetical protein